MSGELQAVFSPGALRALAWGRSFERGEGYVADGRVKRLVVDEDGVSATVRGAQPYRVRLWVEGGEPYFSCTCPVAADGLFCKHGVAVGLAAFGAEEGHGAVGVPRGDEGVRAYLEGLEKPRLVELIMAQAAEDELLRGRLELAAAAARGGAADDVEASFRGAIRDVICPGGFIDYRSMYEYGRGIHDLIEALRGLLAEGLAAELVGLCEHALACLEDALGSVDDSSGQLGDARDRLVALHHEACVRARPDPVALAERLFEWEMHSDWEIFFGAAAIYADVLGVAGLAAYRRLAEEEWARMPALAPGAETAFSTGRFRITHAMQTLAELDGDVDELIAVKERDLSSPYHFMEIAEICASAGRHDDALAWAERGLAAYPECGDVRLLDVLADEYERHGRHGDAVLLMWSHLERRPVLDSYQRLKGRAGRAGEWQAWRSRALDALRAAAARRSSVWGPADRSEVVKALLWERDADAAWDEALAGGCSASLWMELARKRAAAHPEDALPVYERQVERSIAEKNMRGYEDAVTGLRAVGDLLARLGRDDEFPARVAAVRAAHKQKRNLMKLLDGAGW